MKEIIVVPLFYSFSELHIIPYTCLYKRNFIRISTYDAPTRQNGRQTRVRLRVQWATPLPARQCRVLFFFFSGSLYALIRTNLGRLALNRTNLRWIGPYQPKHTIPVPNRLIQAKIQKKKKVQNAPFGRNNKTLNYLTWFILQSSALSDSLCSLVPSRLFALCLHSLTDALSHSLRAKTHSHSPILCMTLDLKLTSSLNSQAHLTSLTHSQLRYWTN